MDVPAVDLTTYRLRGIPPIPDGMTNEGAKEWRQLAPIVYGSKRLTPGDLRALQLLCECLATATALEDVILQDGPLIDSGSGGKKAHPAIKLLESSRKQAHWLLRDFGLTPRYRGSVDAASEYSED